MRSLLFSGANVIYLYLFIYNSCLYNIILNFRFYRVQMNTPPGGIGKKNSLTEDCRAGWTGTMMV